MSGHCAGEAHAISSCSRVRAAKNTARSHGVGLSRKLTLAVPTCPRVLCAAAAVEWGTMSDDGSGSEFEEEQTRQRPAKRARGGRSQFIEEEVDVEDDEDEEVPWKPASLTCYCFTYYDNEDENEEADEEDEGDEIDEEETERHNRRLDAERRRREEEELREHVKQRYESERATRYADDEEPVQAPAPTLH
eukprot:6176596-Pleurochrysis_carterae.AAC.1